MVFHIAIYMINTILYSMTLCIYRFLLPISKTTYNSHAKLVLSMSKRPLAKYNVLVSRLSCTGICFWSSISPRAQGVHWSDGPALSPEPDVAHPGDGGGSWVVWGRCWGDRPLSGVHTTAQNTGDTVYAGSHGCKCRMIASSLNNINMHLLYSAFPWRSCLKVLYI